MRSLLFVPGDSERKLEKALGSAADALIVDLEDLVAASAKPAARERAAAFLASPGAGSAGKALYVRINDLQSGLAEADLAAVMPAAPGGIVLPKAVRHRRHRRSLQRGSASPRRKTALPTARRASSPSPRRRRLQCWPCRASWARCPGSPG